MNLLYFLSVNLPNAWQFGFDPTITYDARATSGNNKFNLGLEYSVVSQDVYGQRAQLVLEVIPVIPAMIQHSILGGD